MIFVGFLIPDSSNSQDDKCVHRVYCNASGHNSIITTCGARWAEDSIKSVCPFCGKKFKIVVSNSEVQEQFPDE